MKDKKSKKTKDSAMLFLFFCCLFIFIGGCEDNQEQLKNENETDTNEDATIEPVPPKEDPEYKFERSYGWLDDETFIYSAVKDEQYFLFSYHLVSQKKHELLKTDEIIAEASVSPNKEQILVYSSADYLSANLRVLTSEGEELYNTSILSSELSFSWNPFNDNVALLEIFNEDWTYQTYILDLDKKNLEEIHVPMPFAQWYSEDSLLYLDNVSSQQVATLIKYDLQTEEETVLYEDVLEFRSEQNISLIIQNTHGDVPSVEYAFYAEKEKNVQSLRIALSESYLEWGLLPFDLLEKEQILGTFMEMGGQQYELTEFNWKTGKKRALLSGVNPAPLSYSPDGKKILYGYTLENVIIK